jgi:hypothetical protein
MATGPSHIHHRCALRGTLGLPRYAKSTKVKEEKQVENDFERCLMIGIKEVFNITTEPPTL